MNIADMDNYSSSEEKDMNVLDVSDDKKTKESTTSSNTTATAATAKKKENPAACIFVASLNKNFSDEELQASVYEHFKKWGNLIDVKVLKDWLKRPYAFVQFESEQDSKIALREAPGTLVNERSIRCEPARVNRSICLISFNQPLNKQFLVSKLSMFGEIEDTTILQPNGKFHYVFIKFKYRDDAIKTYLALKCTDNRNKYNWFVEWASNLDLNSMYGGIYGSVTSRCLDKFSVFIGNLHESITDAELKQEFDPFGDILNIHVIRKPYHYHHKRVFAFIKYQHEGEAAKAIDHENGKIWKDKVIKVCYREYYHNVNRNANTTAAYSPFTAATIATAAGCYFSNCGGGYYYWYEQSNNKQTTYYNNDMMGQRNKKQQIMTTTSNNNNKKSPISVDNNNNNKALLLYKPYYHPSPNNNIAQQSKVYCNKFDTYSYATTNTTSTRNSSSSAENSLFNNNSKNKNKGIFAARRYPPPPNHTATMNAEDNGLFNTPPYYIADPYSTTMTAPMVYYPYPVQPYYYSYNEKRIAQQAAVNKKNWQNQ